MVDSDKLLAKMLSILYPVGCYFHTRKSPAEYNPNDEIGGEWSLLGEGKVLISAGSNYTVDQDYGANTKLIADANIAHDHGFTQPAYSVSGGAHVHTGQRRSVFGGGSVAGFISGSDTSSSGRSNAQVTISTSMSGSTGTHSHTVSRTTDGNVHALGSTRTNFNVMQDSKACYIWYRTA